jgi:hypothetical protein
MYDPEKKMNYPAAELYGMQNKRLSPLSPLHKWRGEDDVRGEAKDEAEFRGILPIVIENIL